MIGIVDSGIGGLSAYLPLREKCESDILYLADEAHLPYGEKTDAELLSYARAAIAFFEEKGADAVLFACGTLSSVALPYIKSTPMPVYGAAEPAAKAAVRQTVCRRVAIAATEATVRSGYLQKLLCAEGIASVAIPCAPFVTLAENHTNASEAYQTVQAWLAPALDFGADTVLLGCTHYAFLKDSIRLALPSAMQIDAGKEAAKAFLKTANCAKENAKTTFFTTGNKTAFAARLARVLGGAPYEIEEIRL